MNKETNFIVKLTTETGMSVEDAALVMKHFSSDGRIDPRSASFQIELVKLVAKGLIESATKLEEKAKTECIQKVQMIEPTE